MDYLAPNQRYNWHIHIRNTAPISTGGVCFKLIKELRAHLNMAFCCCFTQRSEVKWGSHPHWMGCLFNFEATTYPQKWSMGRYYMAIHQLHTTKFGYFFIPLILSSFPALPLPCCHIDSSPWSPVSCRYVFEDSLSRTAWKALND